MTTNLVHLEIVSNGWHFVSSASSVCHLTHHEMQGVIRIYAFVKIRLCLLSVVCCERRVTTAKSLQEGGSGAAVCWHDDAIKLKYFPSYWPFVRKFTGCHRWIPLTPVAWSFDVFFDRRPNKRLSKQLRRRCLKTLSHPLLRHCNFIQVRSDRFPALPSGYMILYQDWSHFGKIRLKYEFLFYHDSTNVITNQQMLQNATNHPEFQFVSVTEK